MSEHNKVGVVGSVNKGMTTITKRSPLRFSRLKLQLGALLTVLLVAAVVVVILLLMRRHHTAKSTLISSATQTQHTSPIDQAFGLAITGQGAAAQKILDTQIAQTKGAAARGQLYEQKSSMAYTDSDFSGALQFAQEAYALNPTINSVNLIAMSAQALGNNGLALQYYQLELQRWGGTMLPTDKLELQNNIKALGG